MQIAKHQKLRDVKSINFQPNEIAPQKTGNIEQFFPLRFWEIDDFFRCPVIGTCLNFSEQKKLLKQAGISVKRKSGFEIHEVIVQRSDNENSLSTKIDCWLNDKFKSEINQFFDLDEDRFIKEWKFRFEKGEIDGVLWVAASRPDLSAQTKRTIFGDIHMEMHLSAQQHRQKRQLFLDQQEKIEELIQKYKEATRSIKIIKKEKQKLEQKQAELSTRCISYEKDNSRLISELSELKADSLIGRLQVENQVLQSKLKKLSEKIRNHKDYVKTIKNQKAKLFYKYERQHEINVHLSKETEKLIRQISNDNLIENTPSSFDLGQKRILVVGGMTRIESLYRRLIEEKGGIFEYHDGNLNRGIKKIENQLKRSDLVICPIDCNSHAASSMVKRLSKKYNKTNRILPNSSLHSIFEVLLEYSGKIKHR